MRLFDFSWQHHVDKQMVKCFPDLEGDTNIRKEEWNEQEIQKHWKAEWVSDVEHSLPYDPVHEHWVTNVHGTYTVSWCCVYNTGRLPSTWKDQLPPSFFADEQRFLVLLASSLHGREHCRIILWSLTSRRIVTLCRFNTIESLQICSPNLPTTWSLVHDTLRA